MFGDGYANVLVVAEEAEAVAGVGEWFSMRWVGVVAVCMVEAVNESRADAVSPVVGVSKGIGGDGGPFSHSVGVGVSALFGVASWGELV